MEQRRLRLGDILDDYCPRERRVTNHAIVAMIEEDIKQTRCTTCDAEHAYKGARVPRTRKKETPSALYKEVLAGLPAVDEPPAVTAPEPGALESPAVRFRASDGPAVRAVQPPEEPADERPEPEPSAGSHEEPYDRPEAGADTAGSASEPMAAEGPVHRRLIRATLPRPEGLKDVRPTPEFTVRQTPGRANGQGHHRQDRLRMRGGSGGGHGEANGNRASRFQGNRVGGGAGRGGRGGHSPFRGGPGGGKGKRGRGPRG